MVIAESLKDQPNEAIEKPLHDSMIEQKKYQQHLLAFYRGMDDLLPQIKGYGLPTSDSIEQVMELLKSRQVKYNQNQTNVREFESQVINFKISDVEASLVGSNAVTRLIEEMILK